MSIIKKLVHWLGKNYWLFLLILVAVSYGQIIAMLPWQDDNAIFFKLAHIQESAGYLGRGIFGEGPYKYTAAFYYPLYLLFGYDSIYYFVFGFLMYFLSVIVLYRVAAKIFDEDFGKLSSFLYACGYMASDGFIRLYNNVITSLSVVIVSLLLYCYWLYFKKRKLLFYFLAVALFYLAIEFARARTHYLIAPIIIFELIFTVFGKKIKYAFQSILRLIPFTFIFYKYFMENPDTRSQRVSVFIGSLLKGDFTVLYGYLSSLSNLFIPDWFTHNFHFLLYSVIFIILVYFLFKRRKMSWLILCNIPLALLWYVLSRKIYQIPSLNPSAHQLGLAYLGGIILTILSTIFFYIRKELKVYYLLFAFWILVSLASYSAYNPSVIYDSINRYLSHSFFALTILIVLIYRNFEKEKLSKFLVLVLIVFYGLGNLVSAFSYQKKLLKFRTKPVKEFYQQLSYILPKIEKGDILYFDVAPDARGYFADAFSVAQMPDTTAIAWRYKIDRYDFFMAEGYQSFIKQVSENNIPQEKIYTFFYSKNTGLVSTKTDFLKSDNGLFKDEVVANQSSQFEHVFKNSYSCVIQPTLSFAISAKPDLENVNLIFKEDFSVTDAITYAKTKYYFYNSAKIFTSSEWKERVGSNLIDDNPDTAWQADRVTWDKEDTFFGFDLGRVQTVGRLAWINAFSNSTPTLYSIETSLDNKKWTKALIVENVNRIENGELKEVVFNPVPTRYIKMVLTKTLNQDSPGISESWIIPPNLDGYSISSLEKMAKSSQVAILEDKSMVSVFWKSNSVEGWKSDNTTSFQLITDGKIRNYVVKIPCSGTKLTEIKFDGFQFPLDLVVKNIRISYSPIH